MWKRILAGIVIVILALGGAAYLNRKAIILKVMSSVGKAKDIAPTREIAWETGPAGQSMSPENRPPNIIFILADDLGINDIDTFGGGLADGKVPTPNISRLAAGGANFTQAYSGTGTCAPSRAMLMTGRYPTRTGFEFTPTPDGMGRIVAMFGNDMQDNSVVPKIEWNEDRAANGLPFEQQGLPDDEITVAEVLKDRGYHTVHIGKWHLGRGEGSTPNDQGFDESLLMASGMFLPENDPDVVNAKLDFDPIDKFLWARMQYAASYNSVDQKDWFRPGGYLTDYWTDESLKVIEANKDRPFFLYLAHWGVHTPLQATKEDYEAVGDILPERERVYAAMLHALDRSLGRILDKLDVEGLSENTIIVFSSDNGGAGYIGIPSVNEPYRGWKITLFEGGIRVPLFIKWPNRIAAGTEVATPVAHIDLMPTLADAAGAVMPTDLEIDGIDLMPLATGAGNISRKDDAIFWSSGYYKVVRANDWKLQLDEKQNKVWLFDLANDPTEQVNLADKALEKRQELLGLIAAHWENARPPLYSYTIEAPTRIDKTSADPYEPGDEYIIWPN